MIASQVHRKLYEETVAEAESRQRKNLNMPLAQFVETIKGKTVREVTSKGKWMFLKLEP